ncbi:MAG: single-stranded-DNA-specific exonuclease RecJ [Bacillota bacterium]|nr:single-stranded-DNA-specific exonuclease RecJ [Bacillota bacterium]
MNRFEWVYSGISPDSPQALALAQEIDKMPVIAALALDRGINSAEKFNKFNKKSPDDLFSPFLMKDMEKAVARIRLALENDEHVTVYGDYDVDGITSISILVKYLRSKGGIVDYYIPDRVEEGYGINTGALYSLFENGTTLLITVDTGITAYKEIDSIIGMGMDVIVTDHHQCKEQIPCCEAVINPRREDCPYPFKSLAGVGVVFKLICGLENGNQKEVLQNVGDIVALGTIADVVELSGENRIIVDYGLKMLKNTDNLGLRTLIDVAEIGEKAATVSGIGYGIAPRINAAGRIGDAGTGVSLFLSENEDEAKEISENLINENKHRQDLEQKIYKEVIEKIEKDPSYKNKPVLVIWGEGWHHGVIGIVSSKISEKYLKPCILITVEGGVAKGSGRSVDGFNLFNAMTACGDIFIKYGGHALAAGLTLYEENLEKLDFAINEYARGFLSSESKKPVLNIDFEMPMQYIYAKAVEEMYLFEPFGAANLQPVFSLSGCTVVAYKQLSEGKHLRLSLEKEGTKLDAIGFGMGEEFSNIILNDTIDVAGHITINEWNRTKRIQIVLKDIRYTKISKKINPVPVREDFANLYSFIRRYSINGFFRCGEDLLARKLSLCPGGCFDTKKLRICMNVFAELSLLSFVDHDGSYDIYLSQNDQKVDLNASRILKNLSENGGN